MTYVYYCPTCGHITILGARAPRSVGMSHRAGWFWMSEHSMILMRAFPAWWKYGDIVRVVRCQVEQMKAIA